MHFDLGGIVGIIVALLTIAAALAAALAVARASFAKAQIEALRGDRDDLQSRVTFLEGENQRRLTDLNTERQKVRVLERVVTGKEQLDHIQSTIDNNHKANLEWQERQASTLKDVLGLLSNQRSNGDG